MDPLEKIRGLGSHLTNLSYLKLFNPARSKAIYDYFNPSRHNVETIRLNLT